MENLTIWVWALIVVPVFFSIGVIWFVSMWGALDYTGKNRFLFGIGEILTGSGGVGALVTITSPDFWSITLAIAMCVLGLVLMVSNAE